VIGGGTAGYFAAIALKRAAPARKVTLVESSKIPIIGVGEATTPVMVTFLHDVLGIDVVDFFARVTPTWKLGIRFDWGIRPFFCYPFGGVHVVPACLYEREPNAASLQARLMAKDRFPIFDSPLGPRSLLAERPFAYHLDNKRFVAYLADHAKKHGIDHLDRTVSDVALAPDGSIDHLITAEGDQPRFDLYVDATGFRSLLLGKTLNSPFQSYASTLLCDSAVVADVPHDGHLKPYTLAETMDAGWCWNIPVPECDHRGYVYSSKFLSADEAEAEMRRKNPGMGKSWRVEFKSGRRRDFWIHNAVGVGNAYGFVEPLESTALHMVIHEVTLLARELARVDAGAEPDRAHLSQVLGANWDYLRWFLGIHYKFNRRLDTPFWQECRKSVDVGGLEDWIDRYKHAGPLSGQAVQTDPRDVVFGPAGFDIMMLGQDVPCRLPTPAIDQATWNARRADEIAAVAASWPQAKALALLRERPDLLREMAHAPYSWTQTFRKNLFT